MLGVGHLHLDVSVPRVVIFRDAILDLFTGEFGEEFEGAACEGWKRLSNYVGDAIIFVKAHYADRINILQQSWKVANETASSEEEILAVNPRTKTCTRKRLVRTPGAG